MVFVLLTALCHQKLNAFSFSLTCSRFNIWLHDVILQEVGWQLSDLSRLSTKDIPPKEIFLLFRFPDSFPRCVMFGILSFTCLDRVELIRGSFIIYRHMFFSTISLVINQRIFILHIVHYLFANLSTPCPLWTGISRGNVLEISLLLC